MESKLSNSPHSMPTGNKCHEGPCGPCYLCGIHASKYTHPEKFTSELYTFLCKLEKKNIEKTVCICYACKMQIHRNIQNPIFTPRWKKKTSKSQSRCGIECCAATAIKCTHLASKEEVEQTLDQTVTVFTVENSAISIPLCQTHYNRLYTQLTTGAPCESCGENPRKGEHFNRHCPNPDLINKYLSSTSNSPSHLTKESCICSTCYKYFKMIDRKTQEEMVSDDTVSKEQRNVAIDAALVPIHAKQTSIYSRRESATMSEYLDYVVCIMCTYVGEKMKVDEAMLLPKLHKYFTSKVYANQHAFANISVCEHDVPSSRWLISHLHLNFENMLEMQCRHRRYGTLLYHKHCDLIQALSSALGKGEIKCDKPPVEVTQQEPSLKDQIQNVARHLNKKLHELGTTQRELFNQCPHNISTFNLSDVWSNISEELVTFLSLITQPVRHRRRKLFDNTLPLEHHTHTKNVRLFYAVCVLAFCTNSYFSAPMHVLVTEAVLCHGGTQELVAILNRLGAAACLDTVNRLATHVVKKRISDGILPNLAPKSFAAVSIDNIDILQPYGFVSCMDATRSWHGTSVQCTQPLPISGHLTVDDVLPSPSVAGDQTNKRMHTSPINTPVAREKHKRRRRTLAESSSPHTMLVTENQESSTSQLSPFEANNMENYPSHTAILTSEDFKITHTEQSELDSLNQDLFHSILLRKAGSSMAVQPFPGLQNMVNCVRRQASDSEVSKITYVEIVSEKADSKPTLMGVISRLQGIFVKQLRQKYVLLVGDAKTYNLLQSIRYEYQSCLKWLIPMPGDWHVLYNYQKALMKPYADAGLVTLAKVTGHRAETLTSLIQATNFRRTHEFLLQSFDALYRYFISLYKSSVTESAGNKEGVDKQINDIILALIDRFNNINSKENFEGFRESCNTLMNSSMPLKYTGFTHFMKDLSLKYETVRFWYQYVAIDCFAYIGLFLSVRYRNWELRNGSLKLMAAVFSAFDRPIYQEIIPQHLKDLLTMPSSVLHHLQKGSFSVRLSPSEWHGVALDECHEMCINKDAKLAVIHPSKHKMNFLSNYLAFRSSCVHNLKSHLFPERESQKDRLYTPTSRDRKRDENIKLMLDAIEEKDMKANGLWNFLDGKEATPEQAHDLLNYRKIGQDSFESYINTRIIGMPSTNAPKRKKRLVTFSVTKVQKQKVKLVEKERKMNERYLKKQLAWISEKGADDLDLTNLLGPISALPRALIGGESLPYRANKSAVTQYLRKRYSKMPIVIEYPLPSWTPHTVILEGMFIIQTTPLPTMSCMREYVQLLMAQYVRPHFRAGAQEVHVVFDNPGAMKETPKEIEQKRRDNNADKTRVVHSCKELNSTTSIPTNWRAFLACRTCKKCLTQYIAEEMITLVHSMLSRNQTFYCNKREIAYSVTSCNEILPCPQLWTNVDEADMRIWLHSVHSIGTKKLIFSPDTDVYHVGLAFTPLLQGMDVVIQLTKTFREGTKFLLFHNLVQAIHSDPDLQGIPFALRSQALQSLYVCTGCDYVSFFRGMGKVSFLSTFFQYASFIAGVSEAPGSIGDLAQEEAYMSFLRLVGATYFRAHTSAFEFSSPATLYHSIATGDSAMKHEQWLDIIRKAIWIRADSESKNMPSTTALKLHWTRCLWVLQMWHKSVENDIDMPDLEGHGWTRKNGDLEIVWETAEQQKSTKERIEYILSGCKCKTGCANNRCKCKKNGRTCGPGCQCINCINTHIGENREWDEEINDLEVEGHDEPEEEDEETDEDTQAEIYEDEETNDIMEMVFGEEIDDEHLYM